MMLGAAGLCPELKAMLLVGGGYRNRGGPRGHPNAHHKSGTRTGGSGACETSSARAGAADKGRHRRDVPAERDQAIQGDAR